MTAKCEDLVVSGARRVGPRRSNNRGCIVTTIWLLSGSSQVCPKFAQSVPREFQFCAQLDNQFAVYI